METFLTYFGIAAIGFVVFALIVAAIIGGAILYIASLKNWN